MILLMLALLLGDDLPERDTTNYIREAPNYTSVTTVPASRAVESSGLKWTEMIGHDGEAMACGAPVVACQSDVLAVRNESSVTLRCQGVIRYAQPNSNGIQDMERTRIVRKGKIVTVVSSPAPYEMKIASYGMNCSSVPSLPPLGNPPECKLSILKPVDPEAYYPQEAKDAWHGGPVILEFTVAQKPSAPTGIQVVQSSTYPELDEAAQRLIGEVLTTTNCDGRRFRTVVDFTL